MAIMVNEDTVEEVFNFPASLLANAASDDSYGLSQNNSPFDDEGEMVSSPSFI